VTGSSVAPVSVGTIATLRGTLLLRSPEVVRADLDLSLPAGSFRLFGFFSASVFSGSGQTISLFAAGRAGVFRSAQGRLHAVTGENTTFTLTLAPFSYLSAFAMGR
jgi:hypothetical protein